MAEIYKKTRSRFSTGGLLLFVLPLPLLFAAISSLAKGALVSLVLAGGCYALYLCGALLNRRGLHNEAEYQQRKITRAPKFPLKILGGMTIGVATGLTTYLFADYNYNLLFAVCAGLGAWLGCFLVYGPDPRETKIATDGWGIDTTDQVLEALEAAERNVAAIERANRQIRNREFSTRLDRITELARKIISVIEEDPGDLRRARKFLNVYLEGAQEVTEGYARTHRTSPSEQLEENFRHVLGTIEGVFVEQHQKLLENDAMDLDVKIEVLANQLKHEGVI